MKREILEFIRTNNLSPFNEKKSDVKTNGESIYKTKDAKAIHNKLLSKIASNFYFPDSVNILDFLEFTSDEKEIKRRQNFFREIKEKIENKFLKEISIPKRWWRPKYGIVAVTESDKTFNQLQKLGCPVKFLITQSDLDDLEAYDIVQVIDCDNFSGVLERLPQSVFLDDVEEAYLERYVQLLSSWTANLDLLKNNKTIDEISTIISSLQEILPLLLDKPVDMVTKEKVEAELDKINEKVSSELKKLTISGDSLFMMLSKNTLSNEMLDIIRKAIRDSGIPSEFFKTAIPVSMDETEIEKALKKQNTTIHTTIAESIKKKAKTLMALPEKFQELSDLLIYFDFISGISQFIDKEDKFPEISNEFMMSNSQNLFIENAQPISFHLNEDKRCSILTGANSGGKTTLLEHIIQLNSMLQIGLPVKGELKIPLFSETYYFAKNKGSLNKGAFETLLTQMSKINPGKKTLILADEIESVTEPGVAGAIVCASADFFIKKGCFMIVATHLGKEIQKKLPENARIDGIEAKGLDEFYELIVDHNPVLGRLANSTPELIIEKMANSFKTEYFNYLYQFIKKEK
jgi:hypothetical protein